ncbi:Leucine-responsive regulatory protein [Desulfamplus magnetovallimortis]|uniref:Leucine-responsive regulatory protein n=1 Tax=Desulfamplus magnetovallimortis TaxID=1246637 RepID=A0A1W1HEY0_9BACT|nr:Lrp/AsnC family transcriptional regulator [Desulfamplus magnetovallimortis]SLM30935.1 Leucine-responsive regulatory protein [Desulfamplus magnetovallimortis]
MKKDISTPEIDDFDYALLNLLQKDGRATNVKIANSLNLSETPCWRRLKRLEEHGIIKGYHANLNRYLLGFDILAFVQVFSERHTDDSLYQFEQAVKEIPEILSCHNITGDADYLLQIVTKNLDTYEKLLRKVIRRLPGVTSIKTSISLREIKDSKELPLTNI